MKIGTIPVRIIDLVHSQPTEHSIGTAATLESTTYVATQHESPVSHRLNHFLLVGMFIFKLLQRSQLLGVRCEYECKLIRVSQQWFHCPFILWVVDVQCCKSEKWSIIKGNTARFNILSHNKGTTPFTPSSQQRAINMISIPWPWQYTISVLANLLAFCAFAVVCLFTNVLIAIGIGMTNGSSKLFLQCRTLAMALVIPLAGLGWCLLLLHLGRYFLWFGLSSYGRQLVKNRKCPKTFCEIT